ncbi:MAG: hypothetical protein RIF37_13350 [Rhodospirillaceae bacterium]
MIDKPVPLTRHFSSVPRTEADSDEQELQSFWGDLKRTGWNELEKEFRCVILAEAGAGKTNEMEARARRMAEQGHAAFFIRIEAIEGGFENAFEVGNANALDQWMKSQEEAWFFLDSVDEARLDNPKAFEKAIRHFAARIKDAQHRAHIFISSRPYAWRAVSDRELLEKLLPFKKPKLEVAEGEEEDFEEEAPKEKEKSKSALEVYFLDPLNEKDIRFFAEHRGAQNIDRLIDDLERANLMSLAARPFDLDGILAKWEIDQNLDGRLELLRHSIDIRLDEIDPSRAQLQPLSREKAKQGAQILAASVILTGEPGIRVPDTTHSEVGINAESLLGDWSPPEVKALLERALFNDALYGLVRFRHREVRELLAAEWFYELLKSTNSRHAIESLFFRTQYGQEVITPRLRPILPWLLLFDDAIRQRGVGISPEIAVEGGDAARLPIEVRQGLLVNIVKRIAADEDAGSAGDNSAIARIAQSDLTDETFRLITDNIDSDDAIFFLGRLVWQGEMTECVSVLSPIAINPKRDIYARIAATRAVMTCGSQRQKDELWQNLISSPEPFPRRLLAEVIVNAEPNVGSVRFLLSSIERLEAYERFNVTGLSQALHSFIDRLPTSDISDVNAPLEAIVKGLNDYLGREPYIERGECHVSEEFAWLIGPATHAVERAASVRSESALRPEALSILLGEPALRFWRGEKYDDYKDQLTELVPSWHDLNDQLFWRSVEQARDHFLASSGSRLTDHWRVQWMGHFWRFGPDRFKDIVGFVETRNLQDDKLVSLSLAHGVFVEAGRPSDLLDELKQAVQGNSVLETHLESLLNPEVSASERKWQKSEEKRKRRQKREEAKRDKNRADWIKQLKADPDIIRQPHGLEPGQFSNHQLWLLNEVENSDFRSTRRGGFNWEVLRNDFGEEVAHAYRDAALAHWRSFTPGLRSEGDDTSSIPYSLIFAMAGLEIESRESDDFPTHLSDSEIRHALRYIVWDLNGFPSWLDQVNRSRPGLVLDAVLTELQWELENTENGKPEHYILNDLVYSAPWLHRSLAPWLLNWLETHDVQDGDVLRYCMNIVAAGGANADRIAKLAQSKIGSESTSDLGSTWFALWVDADSENAIPAVENWLDSLQPEEGSKEAQLFITKLMGSRHSTSLGDGHGSFRSTEHLKSLYVLMHRFVRAEEDIERAGKGVYHPGLRDDAQEARNRLFGLLSEIPGKQTYVALAELANNHPDSSYRPWMKKRAYKRAEADADLKPWSVQQVREFHIHQVRTPETHRQLFDLTRNRLIDLRSWLERGNNSPYKTWQRADDEPEMRNLIAGWLNDQSSGRYNCAQENELSNRQRPDIWTQAPHVVSPVPIELKLLDQGWSGPKLCERLRNQLAGDYLRETTAGCGIFLLVWQGRSTQSKWLIGKKRVGITELEDALGGYWDSISGSFPGVQAIEVIVINLTVRGTKSIS